MKILNLQKSIYLNIHREQPCFRNSEIHNPTLSDQAGTRAGYMTEYYLVQKLLSTKYCIVVAALKYGIFGSTKYSLTIVSTHCDCLITIKQFKQFVSGHFLFFKVSCERLGPRASFHQLGPLGRVGLVVAMCVCFFVSMFLCFFLCFFV